MMGNSGGALHKYTELAYEDELYQGGFIWDYIDQSLVKKDRYGKEFQAYGGDFGDRPNDGNFSGNGIVYGEDRQCSALLRLLVCLFLQALQVLYVLHWAGYLAEEVFYDKNDKTL